MIEHYQLDLQASRKACLSHFDLLLPLHDDEHQLQYQNYLPLLTPRHF